MNENLPEGWVWTTLGGICTKPQYGWTTKAQHKQGTVLLLRTTDISSGTVDWDKVPYCTDVPENLTDYLLEAGDIVISRAGSVGLSYLLSNIPKNVVFASYLIRFHPLNGVYPHYIAYYLQTPEYWERIHEKSAGIALANVNASKLETIELPLAPLPEQAHIVAAIEQQFTRLDSAMASLRSAQAKTKQYRASLLKSAVEGELTKTWRTANPASETGEQLLARILVERRARWEEERLAKMRESGKVPWNEEWKKAYKEPQGPDVANLPELPDGWCWATVEQVAYIQGGIQKQPGRAPRQNAYPYLRVANVLRGKLDLTVIEKMEIFGNELEILRLNRGDLLVVEGNGSKTEIGRSALWNGEIEDCVHQNHIIRVRLNRISAKYVDFYWNSPEGNQRVMSVAASTTGLYTLSVSKISRLPIPLPPLAEQAQIVAEVEAQLSEMAKVEETIEHSLRRAEQERLSILREAFAGRLVEQSPEDEPASVLLERIREERSQRAEVKPIRKKGERKMGNLNERSAYKAGGAHLYHTLLEAESPLEPHELFKQAGLKAEDQPESVATFYKDLVALNSPSIAAIEIERPDEQKIVLKVREPSPDVKAALLREADVEEESKTIPIVSKPILWDQEEK